MAQAPYRHAILFVDNSGADVVLGMLPLARELLKLGAKVWATRCCDERGMGAA